MILYPRLTGAYRTPHALIRSVAIKIIIAGAGKAASPWRRRCPKEGHDITVIDKSGDIINQVSNGLDVICIEGNATNPESLIGAGAREADLIVASTRSDRGEHDMRHRSAQSSARSTSSPASATRNI